MLKKIIQFLKKLFGIWQVPVFNEQYKKAEKKQLNKSDLEKKIVIPRHKENCCKCGDPMMVAHGQIAYTHRSCRTSYRHLLREYGKKAGFNFAK